MPGTITFRPVEANLTHDTDWLGKMDPYCKFSMGASHAQSSVCRHGGTRPHWGDTVNLQTAGVLGTPNIVRLEVFDKDKFRPDDHIAYTDIDLTELEQRGSISKWYPLYHRKKPAGEILIEAAIQQPVQYVQNVIPTTTTYVQETVISSTPVQQFVGESYVVNEGLVQGGLPLQTGLNQNLGFVSGTNVTSYTTAEPLITSNITNQVPITTNAAILGTTPGTFSKVSALGPSGGFPHGYKAHHGTNVGYSERPGYTLGDTEANPTCQSNLDSNGGGFFNKASRERKAEPYSLSNPGVYGVPHGQTIDTAGHLRPDVTMNRQAPIGTINHPGITGYVDNFNTPQQMQAPFNTEFANTGLNNAGLTNTGLTNTGLINNNIAPLGQPGFAQTGVLDERGPAHSQYSTGFGGEFRQ